jgi:hypothetical protein
LALTIIGSDPGGETLVEQLPVLGVADIEDDGDEGREGGGEAGEDVLAGDEEEGPVRPLERVPEGRPESASGKLEGADLVDDEKPGRPGLADDRTGPLERIRDEEIRPGPLRPRRPRPD